MYEKSSLTNDLQICKDPADSSFFNKQKIPSGELLITQKGNMLYLRPTSPYRYTISPLKEESSSDCFNKSIEENQIHQRSSTTIINDIAQSYTFVPALKKTQESLNDEVLSNTSVENFEDELKTSVRSTADLNFLEKLKIMKEKNNQSTNDLNATKRNFFCEGETNKETEKNKNSLVESIVAYCNKCKLNTQTHVVENFYIGSL